MNYKNDHDGESKMMFNVAIFSWMNVGVIPIKLLTRLLSNDGIAVLLIDIICKFKYLPFELHTT